MTQEIADRIFELMNKYKGHCDDDSGNEYYSSGQVQQMLAEALTIRK